MFNTDANRYDEVLIKKYKKGLEIRKKINSKQALQEGYEPVSSDDEDFNELFLSSAKFEFRQSRKDESKKLKKARTKIITPTKTVLKEHASKILNKIKIVRPVYKNLRKKYILNSRKALTKKYREKIVKILIRILKNRIKDDCRDEELQNLCKNIENELFKQARDGKKYIEKIKLIKNNLINVNNEIFYKKILNGIIKPVDLPKMKKSKMASDGIIEQRKKERRNEFKRKQNRSNETEAINKLFLINHAKLAETKENVCLMPNNETMDKIQNLNINIQSESTSTERKDSNLSANNSSNKNHGEISRHASLDPDYKIPEIASIPKNEFKNESSLNSADNIQHDLNKDKFETDTCKNYSPGQYKNNDELASAEKRKSRKDEFWTGQIVTEEGILTARTVSLYNLDHFYQNNFYFLVKNCFNSQNIKTIRSKQVQNFSMFSHLNKFAKTQSHYFLILKLEPFESAEFKNTIKIMGEVMETRASLIYKTLIDKLGILNNNKNYLEMEIPESCSHLISSLIVFSTRAKHREIDHFLKIKFNLEIQKDKDSIMCIIVSENKETLFKNSSTTAYFEREKPANVTESEILIGQTKKDESEPVIDAKKFCDESIKKNSNEFKKAKLENRNSSKSSRTDDKSRSKGDSKSSSRKSKIISKRSPPRDSSRLNGEEECAEKRRKEKHFKIDGLKLAENSSNDCKRTRLETVRSDSSTKLDNESYLKDDSNSSKFEVNSSKFSERSSPRKSSILNDEEKNVEKRRREKHLKITGLKLTDDRKEDRPVVESLFKEIGENKHKIESVWRIERKNPTQIVIVKLRYKEDTISVLQNARKLRFSKKFFKVCINRDLTFAEMLIEKRDRFNLKNASSEFYYEIEHGRIVKIFRNENSYTRRSSKY